MTSHPVVASTTRTVVQKPQHGTLVVQVPASATVYLSNQKMKTAGESRTFKVPVRSATTTYNYPVRVELAGQTKTYTARVRSGLTTVVTATPEISVAQR